MFLFSLRSFEIFIGAPKTKQIPDSSFFRLTYNPSSTELEIPRYAGYKPSSVTDSRSLLRVDRVPITSGVPQDLVLGSIVFLAYINDLPQDIVSQVRLFADYTAIYLTLEGKGKSGTLQGDLDRL